jgi:5-methyltetrahydrofolate--homocysteine methyltransferase
MDELKSQLLKKISELVIQGNYKLMTDVIKDALNSKISSREILDSGLLKGMEVVGTKFRDGIIFLPEVLMSAKTFKTAMSIIEPLLMQDFSFNQSQGKILLGTVKGDIHDIGKNLVGVMLKGNGFSVVDIGVDASTEKFVDGIERENPDIVGLSAMLTTTMQSMQKTVQVLREKYQNKIIIVGGAPVSQNFADEIGADGYAKNAIEAVELCKRLLTT